MTRKVKGLIIPSGVFIWYGSAKMAKNLKKIKVGFVSLGCSKNQIDTEMMMAHLAEDEFEITPDAMEADVIVINTCGFIGDAKQESVDTIMEMAELKKAGSLKKLIVTGCLAERYREGILQELPDVDAVLGVGSVHDIAQAVKEAFKEDSVTMFNDPETCELGGERILTTPSYMAYLRIAEGCNNRCTYCVIPSIRGKYRSRTMESIIEEAKKLEKQGVKELNLIAQDTSSYGSDLYGKLMLPELLRRLSSETQIPWFRLFYCYPDKITDELIFEIRDNPRVLHYIDIPIQHINDTVLKRMNRHGNRKLIEDLLTRLRTNIPDMVIRTTAIVGFPGETEEQFNELLDFVVTAKFNRFGAFSYSREEGTPAHDMADQVDEDEKLDRYEAVMSAQADVSLEYQRSRIGTRTLVLCEGYDGEQYVGRDYANAPDIDGKIYFSSKHPISEGKFVEVEISDADDYDLFGKAVEK